MEELEIAIELLRENYEKALKKDNVKSKLGWALYQTWNFVDTFGLDNGDLDEEEEA